jgi:hypothetical protein
MIGFRNAFALMTATPPPVVAPPPVAPLSTFTGTNWTKPEPIQTLIPGWFVLFVAMISFGLVVALSI